LEATIRVVATSGLRKLTYRAVAEEAGVTHGLVQYHFGSRDALIAEALRYATERSINTSALTSSTGGVEDLASRLVEVVVASPELQLFAFELILEARRRPELAPLVREQYDRYWEATREELDRLGLTDPDLHLAVFATLDGLVFQQVTMEDSDRMERALRALRTLLATAQR
jgi:AcrR family transcriptional regulator